MGYGDKSRNGKRETVLQCFLAVEDGVNGLGSQLSRTSTMISDNIILKVEAEERTTRGLLMLFCVVVVVALVAFGFYMNGRLEKLEEQVQSVESVDNGLDVNSISLESFPEQPLKQADYLEL